MKLWLDDMRDPTYFGKEDWYWALTAEEAVRALMTREVECASLDHDLTQEQMIIGGYNATIHEDGVKSGYDVLLWLEQNLEYRPPLGIAVHSQNPAGRRRMEAAIFAMYAKNFQF
jgi:hypothetical protein